MWLGCDDLEAIGATKSCCISCHEDDAHGYGMCETDRVINGHRVTIRHCCAQFDFVELLTEVEWRQMIFAKRESQAPQPRGEEE